MELTWFVLLLTLTGVGAGLVGSLTGLGGGVVVIPVLAIAFGTPFPVATGVGLITILATSSTTGAAYVRDHLTDVRIGMFLEIATVPGALLGASAAVLLARGHLSDALLVALGAVLVLVVIGQARRTWRAPSAPRPPDRLSRRLRLSGAYYDDAERREVRYAAERTRPALGVMFVAGIVSGMFGIGAGMFKVLSLERYLGIPAKVATTTSNFMIGVTAAAGAGVLLASGYVNPLLATPAAIGTAAGAYVGSYLLRRLDNRTIRIIFLPVVGAFAVETILRGLGGL